MTDKERLILLGNFMVDLRRAADAEIAAFRERMTGYHDEEDIAAAEAHLRAQLEAKMDEYRHRGVRHVLAPHTSSHGVQ